VAPDPYGVAPAGATRAAAPAAPAATSLDAAPAAAAGTSLVAGAAGVAGGDAGMTGGAARAASVTLDAVYAAATDASSAWRALAGLHGLQPPAGPPCTDVRAQGLLCFEGRGGLAQIRQLDRPALLQLADDSGRTATVLLVGLAEGAALLRVDERAVRVPLPELARDWRGDFVALWRPPPGYRPGRIVADDDDTLARWVQARLGAIDGLAGRPLDQQVLAFQLAQGLTPDGLAGAQTLMALNRVSGVDAPRLLSP
jgi:general secretion pathway protein A